MGEPYLGEIRPFAFSFAPRQWALCNGELLPISQNMALYSLIGTQFGGDGRTNFALPDLRGRTPIQIDDGYSVGAYGGLEEVTLRMAEMPAHTHIFHASTETANQFALAADRRLAVAADKAYTTSTSSPVEMADATVTHTGGGQAHDNVQPFQTINYCIALAGYYPPRN